MRDKTIIRFTSMLMLPLFLAGCALTRVSPETHAREADGLDAIGLTLEAARERATQHGFTCDASVKHNVFVSTESGVRKSTTLECDKVSAELFCPQRRRVVFNADASNNTVYAVGREITQRACF